MVKHGNRSASGRSGSSDVLDQLGIGFDVEPAILTRCLDELGITFLFAPRFHPGLGRLARCGASFRSGRSSTWWARSATRPVPLINWWAFRTKITHAAWRKCWRKRRVLRRALVVTGSDGLDEVTLAGPTQVQIVEAGQVSEQVWTRDDFGLQAVSAAELRRLGSRGKRAADAATVRGRARAGA